MANGARLDELTVWNLDRLSHSLKDLLLILDKVEKASAGFRSLTENIDSTTALGRMMMQMVGSFAEFERAMIRERTSAGLAEARALSYEPKADRAQLKTEIDAAKTSPAVAQSC